MPKNPESIESITFSNDPNAHHADVRETNGSEVDDAGGLIWGGSVFKALSSSQEKRGKPVKLDVDSDA